jgi:hypothetical protein
MAQPVGADLRGFVRDPRVSSGLPQNGPNSPPIKGLAAPRGEHQITDFCTFSQFIQRIPEFRRQRDRSSPPVFPEDSDLAGVAPRIQIAPAQPTSLRNA